MARRINGINKSEEIRQLLRANPKVSVKEVRDALKAKGIKISDHLYYFVKGNMLGKQGRKKTTSTGTSSTDAVSMILKVKSLADKVGGMKKLRALVEALSD